MAVRRAMSYVRSALVKPNAAALRGLAAAQAALYSHERGPVGDEALALLEQRKREDDARRNRQGVLVLRGDA